MKTLLFRFLSLGIFFSMTLAVSAEDYVAIAKEGKIFDEANAKYVTLNQKNQEISAKPGMVFKKIENQPGWIMIEYSPGLRAFIAENITTTNLQDPVAGEFKIANQSSGNIKIERNGENWTAISDKGSFNGILVDKILIFLDNNNNPIYSLVNMGNGMIVMTYDNEVTGFF